MSIDSQASANDLDFGSVYTAIELLTSPEGLFSLERNVSDGTLDWKRGPHTLIDVFESGLKFADREFLVYERDRITFREFGGASHGLASALEGLGCKPGDRIAILMRNLPEWPVAFISALVLGAIPTLLNTSWSEKALLSALNRSGARFIITDEERLPAVRHLESALDARPQVILARQERETSNGVATIHSLIGPPDSWRSLPIGPAQDSVLPEADCAIIFTSGTTGDPKGVLLTHRNITSSMTAGLYCTYRAAVAHAGRLPKAKPNAPERPQRVSLQVVPMFHVSGCVSSFLVSLLHGAKIVLMRRWLTEAALQLIETERVNVSGGVPAVALQLASHPARSRYDLSSLEEMLYGGAPTPSRFVSETGRRIRLGNSWGMTETAGGVIAHVGPEYLAKPASCGLPAPTSLVQVVSTETAEPLPTGQVGELWVRGPQIMKGYWNDSAATNDVFVDGWLRTGDLARIDEEGYCYIVDRAKDMLIRAGENIYCTEIEDVLTDHPEVVEAAVIGVPHPIRGEDPVGIVVGASDASLDERSVRAFAASRLAADKTPIRIFVYSGALPRNASGKVEKTALRRWVKELTNGAVEETTSV